MSKSLIKPDIIQLISTEIRTELLKLTNLIRKRCSICSTIQQNILFAYEENENFFYVCSSCIIKLALNELSEQFSSIDPKMKILRKKEIQSLASYIDHILKDEIA